MKSWIVIFLICALSAAQGLAKGPDTDADLVDALSQLETSDKADESDEDDKPTAFLERKAKNRKAKPATEPVVKEREAAGLKYVKKPRPKIEPKHEIEPEPEIETKPARKAASEKPARGLNAPKKAPKKTEIVKEDLEIDEDTKLDLYVGADEAAEDTASANVSISPAMAQRIAQAEKLYKDGTYHSAIELLTPVMDSLPRSGLTLLARCHSAVGNFMNEVRVLDLARAKNPKDYVIITQLGQALARSKRREDALQAFQDARDINPKYRPAFELAAAELEKAGEHYEARSLVNDMIQRFGDVPEYYTTLCRLYFQGDYLEKSVDVCEAAIGKDGSNPENYVHLGQSLKDQEELPKATKLLNDAAKRFPASASVQTAAGEMHLAQKSFIKAHEYFKRAASVDPKNARAFVGYANASFKLQKHEEALKAFTTACKLDRREIKDFRLAIGELRLSRDKSWQSRYESAINACD